MITNKIISVIALGVSVLLILLVALTPRYEEPESNNVHNVHNVHTLDHYWCYGKGGSSVYVESTDGGMWGGVGWGEGALHITTDFRRRAVHILCHPILGISRPLPPCRHPSSAFARLPFTSVILWKTVFNMTK